MYFQIDGTCVKAVILPPTSNYTSKTTADQQHSLLSKPKIHKSSTLNAALFNPASSQLSMCSTEERALLYGIFTQAEKFRYDLPVPHRDQNVVQFMLQMLKSSAQFILISFSCGICLFCRERKADLLSVIQPLSCTPLHLHTLLYFLQFQALKIKVQQLLHLIPRLELSLQMQILRFALQVMDQ